MKNNLKAISSTDTELRVGNYMMLFGGKDLVGEFFTKNTAFDSNFTDIGTLYVDFEHGRDVDRVGNSSDNVLGVVDWKSARVDDVGVFVERVLNRRSEYVRYLEKLIEAGIVGTSSEAVSSGVRKKASGEIVAWPLMRDSLTVTPMEPRMIGENALVAAKALADAFPASRSLAALVGNEVENPITVDDVNDLKSAEQFLREAGLRKQEATAFVSRLKGLVRSDSDTGDEAAVKGLLEAVKRRPLP
jgi:hypothetical protein